MTAEIVSVGTELLLGQIVDSNAAAMGRILAECGLAHFHRQTVGDNLTRASEALVLALSRADVVIAIGGLGPTDDDLTREAIARALDEPIVLDEAVLADLKALYASRRMVWRESVARQARRPACGQAIPNPAGTAPGLICRKAGKTVVALPGPRSEFLPMAEGPVRALLTDLGGGEAIVSRVLRVCGLGESVVAEKLGDLMEGQNPTLAPYAKPAEVHLRFTARASSSEAAQRLIEPLTEKVRDILGDAVYGEGEETLEAAIVKLLLESRSTVATAESLTAGLVGSRFGSVPGASEVLHGGVVAYSRAAKIGVLGVDRETIAQFGTVSAECASAMAAAARERFGADYGVATTGEAGPAPAEKEVGLVYVAVADRMGSEWAEARFRGSRDDIRVRASQAALVLLRKRLLAGRST